MVHSLVSFLVCVLCVCRGPARRTNIEREVRHHRIGIDLLIEREDNDWLEIGVPLAGVVVGDLKARLSKCVYVLTVCCGVLNLMCVCVCVP